MQHVLKVGDQVLITKVSQGDKRDGIQADKVCTIKHVTPRMYTVQPIGNTSKEWVLFHDQVRKF